MPALGEVSSVSVLLTEVQAVVVLVLGAGAARQGEHTINSVD